MDRLPLTKRLQEVRRFRVGVFVLVYGERELLAAIEALESIGYTFTPDNWYMNVTSPQSTTRKSG